MKLMFSHKIIISAALVVATSFTSFAVYNDTLQHDALYRGIEAKLSGLSQSTASGISQWMSGRLLLLDSLQGLLASSEEAGKQLAVLDQSVLNSVFAFTYFGKYDPRTRPWYKSAALKSRTELTEPYRDDTNGKLMLTVASPVHSLYLKVFVFTMSGTVAFFESIGLPGFLAWVILLVEIITGAMLIFKIEPHIAAVSAVPVLLGATWAHSGNGWLFSNTGGGWEYPYSGR
ncbi:DoxX family membrane protein [Pseudomonas shirazensis]|uniref:DoxX family membrane protein n=1 Tax=Pseudomonas shirazensis TaxID=2745494 RepID=UPI00192DE5DC|nr:DoxX family membrane protein [Pseudomonas shirazensis]MBV4500536.1 DoxX family membrane protein [Pseudomonas shirazensis]